MSTDLLLDSSIPIIKLSKPKLIFRVNDKYYNSSSQNQKLIPISECNINITNITTSYVAVRVRTTKKSYYTVEPTFCTLSPNSTIKITIIIHSYEYEKLSAKGHKFRFEGVIIPENLLNQGTRDIFSELTKKKIQVKGDSIKRIVEIINDDDYKEMKSKVDDNNFLAQSVYSIANNNNNSLRESSIYSVHEEEISSNNNINNNLNELKKECEQLKNQNEIFTKELNEIKLKEMNINNENKYKNLLNEGNYSKINKRFILIILIGAIILGFFLTKS